MKLQEYFVALHQLFAHHSSEPQVNGRLQSGSESNKYTKNFDSQLYY